MKNWKTTIAGIGMIITGVAIILNHGDTKVASASIIGGLGLLAAKDGNVTGGTVQQ